MGTGSRLFQGRMSMPAADSQRKHFARIPPAGKVPRNFVPMRQKSDEKGRARFADSRRHRKLVAAAMEAAV
jgi:hypothetical protein